MNATPSHDNYHDEEHQEGNAGPKQIITILVSTGLLGLLIAGAMDVSNDARIALNVAEQHGQEWLLIRGEIANLRKEMLDRTVSRYTAAEQAQYVKYVDNRLMQIERQLEKCCDKTHTHRNQNE